MIKEVIVVEGRDDITAVKRAVEAEVIAVGGFGINKRVIDRIKEAQKRQGVIVLTDPDFAGEKIRKIISGKACAINCSQAKTNQQHCWNNYPPIKFFNLA